MCSSWVYVHTAQIIVDAACCLLIWRTDSTLQNSFPEFHAISSVQDLSCTDVLIASLMLFCHPAEKDEESAKMLESVKVVTAKTGSTVDFSE